MGKSESINGNESVGDLISMIDRNPDSEDSIVLLISLTTQKHHPATYNQFVKELKKSRSLIFKKYSKIIGFEKEISKDITPFGISSVLKSNRQKLISKLKQNKLESMINILHNIQFLDLSDPDVLIKRECNRLKDKFDLKKKGANESLNRFKWAKDICLEYKFEIGARSMQFYIDVYSKYLDEYCESNN